MSNFPLPRCVTTITPQRISFVGGGTDLPSFYENYEGEVINTAINQFIYVTVKKHSELFEEKFRLSYSQTEHANQIEDIENGIARECLRLLDIDGPLYISTSADLPASSGLGSSSSFAVGLLNALHHMKGERVSPGQLAEEACHVEIKMLGNKIGKQDQYAAAFGGINHFVFRKNGRVEIDPLVLDNKITSKIFDNSVLIWTKMQRDAAKVLSKQSITIEKHRDLYKELKTDVMDCKRMLLEPSKNFLTEFGGLLNNSWGIKKKLEKSITSTYIDHTYQELLSIGGYGGKLCGAGGGGFIFEIIPNHLHEKIFSIYGNNRALKVQFEPTGSRVLSTIT